MTNYYYLAKSYDADRLMLKEQLSGLIQKMINSPTDLHHYYEVVTRQIFASKNKLEFFQDILTTKFTLEHVSLFVCKAHKLGGLHLDGVGDPRYVSLNLPLLDNDVSEMIWVNQHQYSMATVDYRDGVPKAGYPDVDLLNIDAWDIIERINFGRPVVIKINNWHAVDNRFNPNPRIALAIRFAKNPTFEDFVSEFTSKGLIGGG